MSREGPLPRERELKDYEKLIEEAMNSNPTRLSYMRQGFTQDDYLKAPSPRSSGGLSQSGHTHLTETCREREGTTKTKRSVDPNKSLLSINGKSLEPGCQISAPVQYSKLRRIMGNELMKSKSLKSIT